MNHRSIVSCIAVAALAACSSEPALVRQGHKAKLINAIRQELLESVVAEKSAVLATTDEESRTLSLDVQRSVEIINRLRGELRALIVVDGRRIEIEKLDAFDAAWSELESVDRRLLALAVANTNLKATRLSTREGAASLDRFVGALGELQRNATEADTLRTLSQASVAALRVQSLLLVHIPTADEGEMTRLEQRMNDLSEEVERSLSRARERVKTPSEQMAMAAQAWAEYRRISAEVLRLSRENTNVISFDVSIHEKRRATDECLTALSALSAAVESGPPAVR